MLVAYIFIYMFELETLFLAFSIFQSLTTRELIHGNGYRKCRAIEEDIFSDNIRILHALII